MKRINMLSKADMVKGQGVLSAHDEQVELAREVMENRAEILENAKGSSDITHYHSINPEYYLSTFRRRKQEALVGYVHFLPETVENEPFHASIAHPFDELARLCVETMLNFFSGHYPDENVHKISPILIPWR